MKKVIISAVTFFSLCLCLQLHAQDAKQFEIQDVKKLSIAIMADVVWQQGESALRIEANAEQLEKIELRQKNNELKLQYISKKKNKERVKVYITSPSIKDIELAGAINFYAQTPIQLDALAIAAAGNTYIEISKLNTSFLDLSLAGSASAKLSGKQTLENMAVNVMGNGKVEALGLSTKNMDINMAGATRAKVNCTSKLDAFIAGSGTIAYLGTPEISSSMAGSGKIIRIADPSLEAGK